MTHPLSAAAISYDHGITCLDTLQVRAGMACCYLIERAGEYAFIEAGTSPGVPRLLAHLAARGIARDAVRYVIPTHVHLDHAGGAGALMQALPHARLVIHPRGARHMIDPSKLIAGAQAVYGEAAVAHMYGQIVPVAEARVQVAEDGARIALGDSTLTVLDSPGHARHHFSVWDAQSQGIFSGDTFGISYREFDHQGAAFVIPTTTPVQFDPEAWQATLARYAAHAPRWMYLTHYGRVGGVQTLSEQLSAALIRYVQIARACTAVGEQRHAHLAQALMHDALDQLRAHNAGADMARARELLKYDMELNAQGLGVWRDQSTR